MKPLSDIEIYGIGIGVVGSGIQFHIGQQLKIGSDEITISNIVRDENSYEEFKEVPYMIYGMKNGVEVLVKTFINQPVYISLKI